MHPNEEHYRRHRREALEMGGDSLDFHGLDQGKESSIRRYALIADHVGGLEGKVLDLACGTAAMLDTFVDRGVRPELYVGVDGLEDHRPAVEARLGVHGIDGAFIYKPMEIRFEDKPRNGFDAAICTGLLGFWGYHSQRQVKSLYRYMRTSARHGCIMVPRIYAPDQMGDTHVRRWDVTDITDLLGLQPWNVFLLPKEFMVCW
ncbi:class I SAM-dependent methyltransferase [Sinorhizobium fredii]|uniref:class I SAM-dependent methyltransferase n=1 Tax=Rhizobium fredii TaxID=380 RepID=UPI0030ADCDB5